MFQENRVFFFANYTSDKAILIISYIKRNFTFKTLLSLTLSRNFFNKHFLSLIASSELNVLTNAIIFAIAVFSLNKKRNSENAILFRGKQIALLSG